jgi:hypothetical protein
VVAFPCGSQSTRRHLFSATATEADKLMAVVVFPTPPFWLAMVITFPMGEPSCMRIYLSDGQLRPDIIITDL